MSLYQRISTTLVAQIDRFVGNIENHDAIVQAAAGDSRRSLAKARVRLGSVRRDGERLVQRISSLETAEADWTERARSHADEEPVALECLRRRNLCRRELEQLNASLGQHKELELRLAKDIRLAEGRLQSLVQQRNLMRTRQSTAEALGSLAEADPCRRVDLEDTFERWEERVTEAEMSTGLYSEVDPFDARFVAAEEQQALRAELNALINHKG